MKTILFVQHAGMGGALVSLSQIIEKLDHNQYESVVLLLRNDQKAAEMLQRCGARVEVEPYLAQIRYVVGGWHSLIDPLHLYFSVQSILRLRSSRLRFRVLLEKFQPNLVYLNSLSLFHYSCVAKGLDIPVILHVREVMLDGFWGIPKRIHQRLIEGCVTKAIFIGEFERERLNASCPYEIIRNYVDLSVWSSPRYTKLDTRSSNPFPTILFVGGVGSIKGLQVLLPALAILKAYFPHFRCVILGFNLPSKRYGRLKKTLGFMGIGSATKKTLDYIDRAELSGYCIIKPFISDPIQEYAQADILVFPSTASHFPRPVMEAGAMGLPVIASDIPGPRDVVVHNKSGLLVPPNDPQALADALHSLLQNPKQRREMGAFGRKIAEQFHSATTNESRILEMIKRLSDYSGRAE